LQMFSAGCDCAIDSVAARPLKVAYGNVQVLCTDGDIPVLRLDSDCGLLYYIRHTC
jgi:hypothetical protein